MVNGKRKGFKQKKKEIEDGKYIENGIRKGSNKI
jgi:hypothetical protein